MSNGQAKKGGQYGINGEWYNGGEFLPSSQYTIKGEHKRPKRKKGTGKQEIEPYVWEIPPTETAKAISFVMNWAMPIKEGRKVVGYERYEPAMKASGEMFLGWHIDELIKMYNDGERWFEPR